MYETKSESQYKLWTWGDCVSMWWVHGLNNVPIWWGMFVGKGGQGSCAPVGLWETTVFCAVVLCIQNYFLKSIKGKRENTAESFSRPPIDCRYGCIFRFLPRLLFY